jgi:hypothetical protein
MVCNYNGVRISRGLLTGELKLRIIGEMAYWTLKPDGTFVRNEGFQMFGTIRTGQHGTVFDG